MCNILNCVSPFWKQMWMASTVLIVNVGLGLVLGYMSILIAALSVPDSPIKIDPSSMSWLTASFAPAILLGHLIASYIMGSIGRKPVYILSHLPSFASLLLTYFAKNYISLLIGRILIGITVGGIQAISIIAIAECVHPKYRCMILNLKTVFFTSGTTIVHALGGHFHWRIAAIMILTPFIVSFVMAFMWPESPAWFASKKRFEDCEDAFFWIRGRSNSSKCEIKELIKAQRERLLNDKRTVNRIHLTELRRQISKRDFLKPLLICICAVAVMEMSGRHTFPTYALQFIAEIMGSQSNNYYVLCLDLIIIVSAICSSILVRIVNIRTLLFSTGSAALITLFVTCIYLALASNGIISNDRAWIVILLFVIYLFLVNLGCSPIPMSLAGEMFPLEHRVTSHCILGTFICGTLMVCLKVFPYLLIQVKIYGTLAISGILTAIGLAVLYFILPETRNKTLQEIEDIFYKKNENEHEFEDDVNRKIVNEEVD
ncbi:facilitated trehalose transporter Tret1-like [Galleria mellonella]|uniref:Facilitated trehalose transporter Tret1-like n=1 Tax=Galleria mellonella TaxID=7137 RepID=A0ABM3MP46_GALME|nr:facilitated trehalose transporter Tret1-like [Galleria mellonella]